MANHYIVTFKSLNFIFLVRLSLQFEVKNLYSPAPKQQHELVSASLHTQTHTNKFVAIQRCLQQAFPKGVPRGFE